MKIYSFALCVTFSVMAAGEMDMPDGVNANKFVASIKTVDIEKKLNGSTEVQKCLKDAKYTKGDTLTDAKFANAEACFKTQLPKDPEQLKKFASNLGLQEYGLIPSNNVKEITNFLSDKLYLAMTGVDRKKGLAELIKDESFKNRKMVDQSDFVDLYKTQLTKNSLFEISRYCFQNLRDGSKTSNNDTFATHWDINGTTPYIPHSQNSQINDLGLPPFDKNVISSDKDTLYQQIHTSLGSATLDPDRMSKFFNFCVSNIKDLCEKYETEVQKSGTNKLGEASCIIKDRIKNLRLAMSNTQKIKEQFQSFVDGKDEGIELNGASFYDRGKSDDKKSIDNLTNFSSADMLEGKTSSSEDQAEKCKTNPEETDCEKFILEGDKDETLYNISLEMRLKKEIEIKRLKELKIQNKKTFEEYLAEQGYLDLLKEYKEGKINTDKDLEDAITKTFDAKRSAIISGISAKLTNRQIKKEDMGDKDVKQFKVDAANESLAERARLAQLVLFNNIISSNLSLSKLENGQAVDTGARNLNALKTELEGQKRASIDETLFTNVSGTLSDNGKKLDFDEIGLGGMFEPVLGNEPAKSKSP